MELRRPFLAGLARAPFWIWKKTGRRPGYSTHFYYAPHSKSGPRELASRAHLFGFVSSCRRQRVKSNMAEGHIAILSWSFGPAVTPPLLLVFVLSLAEGQANPKVQARRAGLLGRAVLRTAIFWFMRPRRGRIRLALRARLRAWPFGPCDT